METITNQLLKGLDEALQQTPVLCIVYTDDPAPVVWLKTGVEFVSKTLSLLVILVVGVALPLFMATDLLVFAAEATLDLIVTWCNCPEGEKSNSENKLDDLVYSPLVADLRESNKQLRAKLEGTHQQIEDLLKTREGMQIRGNLRAKGPAPSLTASQRAAVTAGARPSTISVGQDLPKTVIHPAALSPPAKAEEDLNYFGMRPFLQILVNYWILLKHGFQFICCCGLGDHPEEVIVEKKPKGKNQIEFEKLLEEEEAISIELAEINNQIFEGNMQISRDFKAEIKILDKRIEELNQDLEKD